MKTKRKKLENESPHRNNVSHLIIRYKDAIDDQVLKIQENRGRKFLLCKLNKQKETHIKKGMDASFPDFVIWKSDLDGKLPILEVGTGGTEVTLFTEKTKQDRHKHLLATEMYTILEGSMRIKINGKEIKLKRHDEAIILPGTVQEILPKGSSFVTRGRTINCHGEDDKYIEINGKWKNLKNIK